MSGLNTGGARPSKFNVVRANWKDPIWLRNSMISKVVRPMMEWRNQGVFLLDESWDCLIILDACRYDVFRDSVRRSGLRGSLASRTSRATDTGEFLARNFLHRKCEDVVYVSANPFADRYIKGRCSG